MPMDRTRYPPNWAEISLARREQAGWQCEWCGAKHKEPHPITGSKVVLTVAHLGTPLPDGTPVSKYDTMDCRPENLAALCQRCHLRYDLHDHIRNAKRTRLRRIRYARLAAGQQILPLTFEEQ